MRVPRPVLRWLRLRCDLLTAVADKYGVIVLEHRLKAKVVVYPAIAEEDLRGVRRLIQIGDCVPLEMLIAHINVDRREKRWEGRRGADGDGQLDLGIKGVPSPVVSHVFAGESPQGSGLHVGGIDDENR